MRSSTSRSLLALAAILPLGCGGASSGVGAATSNTVASGTLQGRVRVLPPMRPCEIVQETAEGASDECVMVERVQPESRPYGACSVFEGTQRYRYDAEGRIVESPSGTYDYTGRVATVQGAEAFATVEFDASGRIVRSGDTAYRYDADGRCVLETAGDSVLRFEYAADETYTTSHNHPDTDEFCVADRVEVVHDDEGRAVLDRYDGCQINEPLRTLRYAYDGDRIVRVEIDTGSDGTVDRVLTLRYACDAP